MRGVRFDYLLEAGPKNLLPPRLVHVGRTGRRHRLSLRTELCVKWKFFRHGPKRPSRAKFRHRLPKLQAGSPRTGLGGRNLPV